MLEELLNLPTNVLMLILSFTDDVVFIDGKIFVFV